MRLLVKKDLGLKSLVVVICHQLTPFQHQGRGYKGQVLLSQVKNYLKCKVMFFYETELHIDKQLNRRIEREPSYSLPRPPSQRTGTQASPSTPKSDGVLIAVHTLHRSIVRNIFKAFRGRLEMMLVAYGTAFIKD